MQHALSDDSAYAYLGCPEVAAALHYPMLGERRGILELGLGRRD